MKKDNKPTSLAIPILWTVCTFIWIAVLVMDFLFLQFDTVIVIMHIVCVVACGVCAVCYFIKHKKDKANKPKEEPALPQIEEEKPEQ